MASLTASSAGTTGTAVSLQDSYKDVTEWYASRTTVNDASSFRVLAISLLVLPWIVIAFFAFINFNTNTFLTPRIRQPKGKKDAAFNIDRWLRNYLMGSEVDWLTKGIPYKHKPWSFDHIVVLRFSRVCFHLMCVIAVLAGTTLIPTYNTNTASVDTSFFNQTLSNATGTNTVTSAIDKAQSFLYFDQLNAKITNVDDELLWFPVGVCAAITIVVQIALVYHTRSLTKLKCQWLAKRNDIYLRTLIMYRLENFGEKLADENFHQLIRKSFQAMGIPAPDIAPSYRLKDSLAQSIVSTTIKRICCCGSGDSEEKGLLAGGGKRKNLFRLTVRVNKSVTQMEKVISSYHIKRKELAPLKGKMLSASRNVPDGPIIYASLRSLLPNKSGKPGILGAVKKSSRQGKVYQEMKALCTALRQNCHKMRIQHLHGSVRKLYGMLEVLCNDSQSLVFKQNLRWLSTLMAKQEHPTARSAFQKLRDMLLKHRRWKKQYSAQRKIKSVGKEEPDGYISLIFPTTQVAYAAWRQLKKQGHFRLLKKNDPDSGYTKISLKHFAFATPVRMWNFMGETKGDNFKRGIAFLLSYGVIFLTVTGPVTLLVAGTSKFAYIGRVFPFMAGWVDRHPQVVATLSLVLPILLMALLNGIVVPILVEYLAEYKGEMSHSAMNRSLVRYLYFFQVVQQFILFIVFGTVIAVIANFVQLMRDNRYNELLPSLLETIKHSPREITASSTYWLAWLAMQSDFAFFGFLFGWKEQFFRWWYDYSVKIPVPRDDYNLHMAEPFDFGYRMSNLLFQMTVALVMVPIAPLCSVVAANMFFWANSSYKFQILVICQDDWEGRGQIWETLCSVFQVALALMHSILAGVLAYHSQSWMLPLGALAPLPLLLLVRTSVFKVEFSRMRACEQVSLSTFKWGKQADDEIAKDTQGSFSDAVLSTVCATLLEAQLEGDGGMSELLKAPKGKKSELQRRLERLKKDKGMALGRHGIKASLEKAKAFVKDRSRKDYYGPPALNPSISDPFYHLLLEDRHTEAIGQFCYEFRCNIARGEQRSILAGLQLIEGFLRVTARGLVKIPNKKGLSVRSRVLRAYDDFLRLWVEDPKLVQAFLQQTFQPGEADKHSVSGT